MKNIKLLLVTGLFFLLVVACNHPNETSQPASKKTGSTTLQFSAFPTSVDSVIGSLAGKNDTLIFQFSETKDTVITFSNIPTGKYDVHVEAFLNSIKTWDGQSQVVVEVSQVSKIQLFMYPFNAE